MLKKYKTGFKGCLKAASALRDVRLMCVGINYEAKYAQRVASAMDVSTSPMKECSREVICSGNGGGRGEDQTGGVSDDEERNSAVETESADEDALNSEMDEIMRNIFGDDYKNEDSSEELY